MRKRIMNREEESIIEKELEDFKAEKEKIRQIVGKIGGKKSSRNDKVVNSAFIGLLLLLFIIDIMHAVGMPVPISTQFTIILAVLMVSLKIIWMMHKNAKVNHFQFWILSSIEFRLNDTANRLKIIEKILNSQNAKIKGNK
jgi:hypothetical protein